MMKTFDGIYRNRRVLVTGHTGFKGSWLSIWLNYLGAKVTGYSKYLPSNPCNFQASRIKDLVEHNEGDILDLKTLSSVFRRSKPEIVFHLAAQPIVRLSYRDPKATFDTNIGGTINVLECIRNNPSVKAAVIITSDKCYKNREWEWGYRENDELGGDDPYSASKACAEFVTRSYIRSFFSDKLNAPRIASTRAGNVIGGGDWALNRIVPDCIRAWTSGKPAVIRNPSSTRPWQHVLEPLSGYLWLASSLFRSDKLSGEAFNFGPDHNVDKSVKDLLDNFSLFWEGCRWKHSPLGSEKKESVLLKLSIDKVMHSLQWHPVLNFNETVKLSAEWYKEYYSGDTDMLGFTVEQIEYYMTEARRQKLAWESRLK